MSRAASGGVLATEGPSVAMEGNPGRECYPGDGTEGGMRAQRRDGGQTVVSSLALQMFLYFNCYFFPFWWACHIVMLDLKYFYLSTYYRITLTALIVVMTLVEVARLYLGYLGNLQEKVPALAGSWLLSLLLQAPMLLFHLFNPHLILLPVEWATGLLYLAFITTEIVLSIRALRRLAAQLEERFHLAHLHLHQERAEGETA